ncbi:MAG: hypothetical protein MUF37_00485 [Methanoregulaceae archaeon]|nr:hypothetical protein [Methanoregulaceae archaeon]
MVFCILPVQADYWAGVSENGQYQVTFTPNADGGATIQGAAVGPGGSIDPIGNPPAASGGAYGFPDETTSVTQNLILEGPSGWAEVIARDANGNEAHAEVEFTDGHLVVFQHAGPITPFISPESYGTVAQVNGVVAGQCVLSHSFSTIEAESYSFNADGSSAGVIAAASSNDQSSGYRESNGYSSPLFFVHQGTGSFTPELDGEDQVDTYSGGSIGYYGSPTYAYECGWIKRVDTAGVIADSSIPQGFTSLVSGTVEDGNLEFHLGASAGPSYCGNSIKTTASGEVEARGDSGAASAITTGPNGQFANVVASFDQDYCTRNYMDFDLSASGKLYADGDYKLKAKNEIYRPCGYSGVVNASSSDGDSTANDGAVFFHGEHDFGGVAGVRSGGSPWACAWTKYSPP